ncbi:hypothetical protein [Microbulbifer sp. GL-2]|uniref:hypothetical protein n=1 Tax=Microbulbifer sp. GL-2 TaxID=2591606 RepID=UPI0011631652|nr:hypothetical protein [Microbulbifer sp. GL-2]BBM03264.1 hypothetical protein GL2_33380 [Microbulbifer sp. GL-2]
MIRTIRLKDIARFFLLEGAGVLILTAGAQGAMYQQQGGKIDIPSFDIEVIRFCGCGDCFTARFETELHCVH